MFVLVLLFVLLLQRKDKDNTSQNGGLWIRGSESVVFLFEYLEYFLQLLSFLFLYIYNSDVNCDQSHEIERSKQYLIFNFFIFSILILTGIFGI